MWEEIVTWLARHARSRYVQMLEQDVERLREDARAAAHLDADRAGQGTVGGANWRGKVATI